MTTNDSHRNPCIGMAAGFFLEILRHKNAHHRTRPPSGNRPDWTAHSNIASILCLSMLFSKISGKFPDTFEKNTSSTRLHRPSLGSLNDHSRMPRKQRRNQAGDIYYSTLFRFVKRVSEDFLKILRPRHDIACRKFRRRFVNFEENTGPLQNRHHIKYTRIPPLSSKNRKKYRKIILRTVFTYILEYSFMRTHNIEHAPHAGNYKNNYTAYASCTRFTASSKRTRNKNACTETGSESPPLPCKSN